MALLHTATSLRTSFRARTLVFFALVGALLPTSVASATWSIIIINTRTGEVAIGSATCLSNFDLRAASPVLVPGFGAAAAQSFIESTGFTRVVLRDAMVEGLDASAVFAKLAALDAGHQTRQYGYANVLGGVGNFSGSGAFDYKGGITGQVGDIIYTVQGNILTGEPVLAMAATAIENTTGSIAEKLMAGMQAARSMGGDGRCSCSSSAPTSCGSPPTSFVRSASTGYMMIARTGDVAGCNAVYKLSATGVSFGVAVGDFNNDGLADVVSVDPGADAVSVYLNTTQPGAPFIKLTTSTLVLPASDTPREVETGDFDADGNVDIVCTLPDANAVGLFLGNGDGTFNPVVTFATINGPKDIAVGDFDGTNGLDIATSNPALNAVTVLLNTGAGAFGSPALLVASSVSNIVAADIDRDGDIDILHNDKASLGVRILENNGAGSFTQGDLIVMGNAVDDLAVGHLDANNELDIVTMSTTQRNFVAAMQSGESFTVGPVVPLATNSVHDIAIGNIDNDGNADVVIAGPGTPDAIIMLGSGTGAFTATPITPGTKNVRLHLADMDNDGDDDFVGVSASRKGVTIADNTGGSFVEGGGCADGTYYMNLNAIDSTSGPDIVETLQTQFDAWQDSIVGRPDAIKTTVVIDPPMLNATLGNGAVLTINVKDANGEPVLSTTLDITIVHAPASAGITTVTPPFPLAPGVYKSLISASTGVGTDEYIITIDDGIGPIVLMPNRTIEIELPECYADCDNSGALNILDFICFGDHYANGNQRADCDLNGMFNILDYICFGDAFAAGCP